MNKIKTNTCNAELHFDSWFHSMILFYIVHTSDSANENILNNVLEAIMGGLGIKLNNTSSQEKKIKR